MQGFTIHGEKKGVGATGPTGPAGADGISPTIGGNDGNVQFNDAGSLGGTDAFFWDNANSRLGIGTNAPDTPLHIKQDGSLTPLGFLDVLLENTDTSVSATNQSRFRMQCFDAAVQGTVFGATSSAGFDNVAFFINTEYGDVWLAANNTTKLVLSKDGPVQIGGGGDDGTGSDLQIANTVSIQGQQGIDISDAAGTFVGGIRVG